ncbi:hypothetical protein TWF718_006446 [Orbilia javanica]|uniref:Uncharacterized protein n=1 Tax=Orbilia javanica TaxID=47235 RepID=A0AAN8N501_9PEZI
MRPSVLYTTWLACALAVSAAPVDLKVVSDAVEGLGLGSKGVSLDGADTTDITNGIPPVVDPLAGPGAPSTDAVDKSLTGPLVVVDTKNSFNNNEFENVAIAPINTGNTVPNKDNVAPSIDTDGLVDDLKIELPAGVELAGEEITRRGEVGGIDASQILPALANPGSQLSSAKIPDPDFKEVVPGSDGTLPGADATKLVVPEAITLIDGSEIVKQSPGETVALKGVDGKSLEGVHLFAVACKNAEKVFKAVDPELCKPDSDLVVEVTQLKGGSVLSVTNLKGNDNGELVVDSVKDLTTGAITTPEHPGQFLELGDANQILVTVKKAAGQVGGTDSSSTEVGGIVLELPDGSRPLGPARM